MALREEEIQDDLSRITSQMPAEQKQEGTGTHCSKKRKGRTGTNQPGQAKGGKKKLEGPCTCCLDACKHLHLGEALTLI